MAKAVSKERKAEVLPPTTGNAVALAHPENDALTNTFAAGEQPSVSVVRHITKPLLKVAEGQRIICRIDTPIYTSKINADGETGRGGKPKMKPAEIWEITAPSGQVAMMIVPAVLQSEIERTFGKAKTNDKTGEVTAEYVGKWFLLERGPMKETGGGQRYSTWAIAQVEKPAEAR